MQDTRGVSPAVHCSYRTRRTARCLPGPGQNTQQQTQQPDISCSTHLGLHATAPSPPARLSIRRSKPLSARPLSHLVRGPVHDQQRHIDLLDQQVVGEDVGPGGPVAQVGVEHTHTRQQRRVQDDTPDTRPLRRQPHLHACLVQGWSTRTGGVCTSECAAADMHLPTRTLKPVGLRLPCGWSCPPPSIAACCATDSQLTVGPEPTDCPYSTTACRLMP